VFPIRKKEKKENLKNKKGKKKRSKIGFLLVKVWGLYD